jgi:hypothetical protein
MKYNGPKGIYLFLVGWRDVEYYWMDQNGIRHKKPYFKEALELWIMPPEYHQSWKRFFVFKGHVPAPEVYSNKSARVYGQENIYSAPILPPHKLEDDFPNVYEYYGPPKQMVKSWIFWKKDIKAALDACSAR